MKKILKQVTVTGVDDSIEPQKLVDISQTYPFVEFGILCSKNSTGYPRFPSRQWFDRMYKTKEYGVHLSMHLCGSWVRSLMVDGAVFGDWISAYFCMFDRVQLNFHAEPMMVGTGFKFIGALKGLNTLPIIFQMDGVNEHLYRFALANRVKAYPLYDLSGGNGLLPEKWLAPQGDYCGYAGGLSPDNLKENLGKLSGIVGNTPIWVDAETHLRSNDDKQFDISKVIRFLDVAEPFVRKDEQ